MKRNLKLQIALLLIFTCLVGIVPVKTAEAAEYTDTVYTEFVDLQILATSDLHGKFYPWTYILNEEDSSGSMLQLATAVRQLRSDNSLLVDAGDTIQDNSAQFFLDEDIHPMIAAMNTIGYDVWVTGNHEYNFGMDTLKKVISSAKAKVLVGNVYDVDGTAIADGYTIFEKAGVRIGVIGMVTPNITHWDAINLAGCTVTDPVEEARKIIDQIKDEVDVLIAVVHMGLNNEFELANSGAGDLAEACPELALIVAAHDHQVIESEFINDVLVVENKNQAQTVNEIHLYLGKASDGWHVIDRSSRAHEIKDFVPDVELADLLKPWHEKALADANEVIGRLEGGSLAPENEIAAIPSAQIMDTALIDLINEVQMYYTGAKVSTAALYTIDANLHEGEIHKSDSSLVYKYDNTLYTLRMTGAQLKRYMEYSAGYYNQFKPGDLTISFSPAMRAYSYDMLAGVNYDIDISKPVGQRIVRLTWPDGSDVANDDVFDIAMNSYAAKTVLLSDTVFEDGDRPELLEMDVRSDIGGVREMIGEYIRTVKGGVLTPACDNNWRLVGYEWDEALHQRAVELLADGTLSIPSSEDGRTPNVKSITVDDLK